MTPACVTFMVSLAGRAVLQRDSGKRAPCPTDKRQASALTSERRLIAANGYILLFDVMGGGEDKCLYEPVYPKETLIFPPLSTCEARTSSFIDLADSQDRFAPVCERFLP
ncbi:hypothetical protein JZ751_012282 [Albula glossodonta]|uniref:Uncharacterized protein n=1 Tax=Albula glossodonta TaxID=121402 RepID=A0A8T2PS62_9TELE|nr:hypothetical protein JZ751_012282 [Albula glossodonta]